MRITIRWRVLGATLAAFALLAAACGEDGSGEGAASDLVFGGPAECPTRASCLIGLNEAGIEFAEFKSLDSGGPVTRTALAGGEIDVALLFSTDASIAVNGWVVLEDDIGLNPVENITPVVRQEVVDSLGGDFVALVDAVTAKIDTAGLTELNRQQSVDGDDPAQIAARWLAENGEASAAAGSMGNEPIVVSSFNFGESEILAEIYAQELEAGGYAVERKLNLGNREVVKPALEAGEIDFIPEYAGTVLTFLGGTPTGDSASTHADLVEAYGELGIAVLDYGPAEDKNSIVVTAEVAEEYGLTKISDLAGSSGGRGGSPPPSGGTREAPTGPAPGPPPVASRHMSVSPPAGSVPVGAEIREVVLPLRRPYHAASTAIRERRLLLLRITDGRHEGWGECGPVPGYSIETLEECRRPLRTAAAALLENGPQASVRGPAAVRFAVEAAAADLEARRDGIPLRKAMGGTRRAVPVGAVIGDDVPCEELPAIAESLAEEGYRRIKLKVSPGRDTGRVAAVRAALPRHALAVDANGGYDPSDPTIPARLEEFDLSFIEQPFPADADRAHCLLAAAIVTPICLDESIDGAERAGRLLDAGAAAIINLKPARVGGLKEAVAVHDAVCSRGAGLWCGGMLESGIGKAAALAVATLPGMTLPADLPPSTRHFVSDVVAPDWRMTDGCLHLSDSPGLGIRTDPDILERITVAVEIIGKP